MSRGARSVPLPRVYNSSYDNPKNAPKGGVMSSAPRKLWNSTWFEPTDCHPLGPAPGQYNTDAPKSRRTTFISKASREAKDVLTATEADTPGPGYYSTVDLKAPFTSFGDYQSGCKTIPPSLRNAPRLNKGAPRDKANARPPSGRAARGGQKAKKGEKGEGDKDSEPGPLTYNPDMSAVIPRPKGAGFIPKGDRFPKVQNDEHPGPSHYDRVFPVGREATSGPRISQRRRSLENVVGNGKNLSVERKRPGPGSYKPRGGKRANYFPDPKDPKSDRSRYIVSVGELYGNLVSE